jgi:glycosidase
VRARHPTPPRADVRDDRRRIELAHSLLPALPGTPVIRYGDEIGIGEDLSLSERLSVRTPMQWQSTANGGFSTARAVACVAFLELGDGVVSESTELLSDQAYSPISRDGGIELGPYCYRWFRCARGAE